MPPLRTLKSGGDDSQHTSIQVFYLACTENMSSYLDKVLSTRKYCVQVQLP